MSPLCHEVTPTLLCHKLSADTLLCTEGQIQQCIISCFHSYDFFKREKISCVRVRHTRNHITAHTFNVNYFIRPLLRVRLNMHRSTAQITFTCVFAICFCFYCRPALMTLQPTWRRSQGAL